MNIQEVIDKLQSVKDKTLPLVVLDSVGECHEVWGIVEWHPAPDETGNPHVVAYWN